MESFVEIRGSWHDVHSATEPLSQMHEEKNKMLFTRIDKTWRFQLQIKRTQARQVGAEKKFTD